MDMYIVAWLLGIDIIIHLIRWYADLKRPEPLTAAYFDFIMFDLKNELTKIADESNELTKKEIIDKVMHNYLMTRDLINKKKNGKEKD